MEVILQIGVPVTIDVTVVISAVRIRAVGQLEKVWHPISITVDDGLPGG